MAQGEVESASRGGTTRRAVLISGAAAATGGGVGAWLVQRRQAPAGTGRPVVRHQVGVVSRPAAAAVFVAWDVTVEGLTAVASLLHEVSAALDRLGHSAPGTEATLSVGASLFAHRFGLAGHAPVRLVAMSAFPNDALDPIWSHGDLLLQVCAPDVAMAWAALGEVTGAAGDRVRE